MAARRIIDGDGHIFEDLPEIAKHIPDLYRSNWRFSAARMFPPLDHLHKTRISSCPGRWAGSTWCKEWVKFMGDVGIESTVLYPTNGLAMAKWWTMTGPSASAARTTTGSQRPTWVRHTLQGHGSAAHAGAGRGG